MRPREGYDIYELLDIPREADERAHERATPAPSGAQPTVARDPASGRRGARDLSFEVVLPSAQARRVAETIEAACRRDRLGLEMERRAHGPYGALSVKVTGAPERVNALRFALADVMRD